jgi:thioester reductase-like protein
LGDLAAPDLGISPEQRQFLAQGIQDIYHCGANVQHAKPWADLAPANVEGTASILRFGALAGARVHHISSIAVFPFSVEPQAGRHIDETTRVGRQAEPFFGDYAETKRAAEELVEQARKQGVDVRIYRLGLVTGSNHQALCPADDAVWRAVQGIATIRALPQLRGSVSLSPVDGVARGIRVLAQRNEPKSTWHLVSPDGVGAEDLAVALQAVGIEVRAVPPRVWQRQLEETVTREMAIYPILPKLQMLDLEALDQSTNLVLTEHTWACLDTETRAFLRMDRALLSRYLASLQDRGALPSPWGGPTET